MNELPVTFGPEHGLMGLYNPGDDRGDLCCLLINAGVVSRIGPNRLNVRIARALEKVSIASLRFDLSGLGDSKPALEASSYLEQAVKDVRAAMDFVERHGGRKRRFVIFGICSGAVNAHHAAVADERIVGALMLDGYWYRTVWTEPMRLWLRFRKTSPAAILGAVRRRLRRTLSKPPDDGNGQAGIFSTDGAGNPPPATFAAHMNALTARGVGVFLLYTSSATNVVSYSSQIRQAFRGEPFARRIRCELRTDIDHTAISQDMQRRAAVLVRDWVVGFR